MYFFFANPGIIIASELLRLRKSKNTGAHLALSRRLCQICCSKTTENVYVLFSAANQTSTASVENGNQDQIPLHSMIGLNDGFT